MSITKEQLLEYHDRLQFVIDTASIFVDPTPDHPDGCARTNWIEQANFWQSAIADVDIESNKQHRAAAIIVFSTAFCNSFDKTLDCLDVDIPRKSDEEYKKIASTIKQIVIK